MNLKLRKQNGRLCLLQIKSTGNGEFDILRRTHYGTADFDFHLRPEGKGYEVLVFNSRIKDHDDAFIGGYDNDMTFGEAVDFAVEFAAR